jgi:hypothetical protein
LTNRLIDCAKPGRYSPASSSLGSDILNKKEKALESEKPDVMIYSWAMAIYTSFSIA